LNSLQFLARERSPGVLLVAVLSTRNLLGEFLMIASTYRSQVFSLSLIILPAFLMMGCGLADYEAKMAAAQAAVKQFDDENKYLEEYPIEWPPDKEGGKGAREADLFFRPPKGIGRRSDPTADDNHLYTYSAIKENSFVSQVDVGVVQEKEEGDLFQYLLPRFGGEPDKVRHEEKKLAGGRTLKVDYVKINGNGSSFLIYGWHRDGFSFAIVFKVESKKNDTTTNTVIDLCLKSIVVGKEAAEKRRMFSKSKPTKTAQAASGS